MNESLQDIQRSYKKLATSDFQEIFF